ncbi:F-box/LRR-repeat protein 2 [Aplysia californica]|uniref:F-box/LRR-repeat protein 2 n=1 Tax=Aplysia californica TaxID=6500 RepID=A0ABM1A4T0_APLCA|nr:F-box/LRR-repeat protein 2 [Aplysia californica]
MLRDVFSQFGRVLFAKIVFDHATKQPKGFGFVEFEKSVAARKALSANPESLQVFDRMLRVRPVVHNRQRGKSNSESSSGKDSNTAQKANPCDLDGHDERLPMTCGTQGAPFDILSDDELVLILTYLGFIDRIRVERVCSRWQTCALRAAKTERHLTLYKEFRTFGAFSENIFHKIMSRCSQNLKSLDISQVSSRFGNRSLSIIGQCCSNIEQLDMSGVAADNHGLEELANGCKNLKSLTINRCYPVGEKGVANLFRKCQKLEKFVCMENQIINGKFLKYAQPSMKTLCLGDCHKLTDEGVMNIVQRCPNLQDLELDHCSRLSLETLNAVVKSLHHLRVFSMGANPPDISKDPAPHTVHHLVNPNLLISLNVQNTGLEDRDFSLVCRRCVNIVDLDISCNKLTDKSVTQISNLKHLEVLNACHLQNITDESLLDTVNRGNLRKLLLQGSKTISDRIMLEAAMKCPQLEEIDVAGNPFVTYESLECFHKAAEMRKGRKILCYFTMKTIPSSSSMDNRKGIRFIDYYRPKYSAKISWRCWSDQEAFDLSEHNMELLEARSYWPMSFNKVDATAYRDPDSDTDSSDFESTGGEDDDEFLLNDDPLEAERFEMS